jgi:hypothetical protein
MRGLGYCKEVRVVWIWSDMYRDHGEYIWTWLKTGEVRECTDVPLQGKLLMCICPEPEAFMKGDTVNALAPS